jgi:chromate transporter
MQRRHFLLVAKAMKATDPIITLAVHFALISLVTIGGANTAIPEMHRIAVQMQGWMNDQQFSDMFAIAQLTPGPNVIIATLIGYQVSGFTGAAVATLAVCGPTCVATYCVARVWDRFRDAPLRKAIQAGLVPVSIGLLAASAYILFGANEPSVIVFMITAVAAAFGLFLKTNPLWIFAIAAILGAAGFL